jgi:DNA replication protein DnaC
MSQGSQMNPGLERTGLGGVGQKLARLKLGRMGEVVVSWIEQASATQMSYADFLDELLSEELLARQEKQLRRRLQLANFPFAATIEQFDFTLRPELKRAVILRYFDSSFITSSGSLVLIGPSGTGKTHLAIAAGTKMAQLGYSVRFVTAQQLANQVLGVTPPSARSQALRPWLSCELLILDEFGYLPLDPQIGPVLYELIAGRYQKGATILTSNKSLPTWSQVIGDSTLMMAVLDRLLHHGEVFYFRGGSYRLRGKEALALAPTGTLPDGVPPSSPTEVAS